MSRCLRQSFSLPKKLGIYCTNFSTKSFSALAVLHGKHGNYHVPKNLFLKKTSTPKQTQYRYFSLDKMNNFFESVRTSEANKLVTNILIGAHDFTGVSWTTALIAATVIMKLFVSLPCGIYQQYLLAKLELTKLEVDAIAKKLKDVFHSKAIRGQWTEAKFQSEFSKEVSWDANHYNNNNYSLNWVWVKQTWKTMVVKNNCHPFKITILFFIQLPFWLLLTVAIRSLAMEVYNTHSENPVSMLQFQAGGPFWCPNLSLPDPTLTLPLINTLSLLTVTELSLASKTQGELVKNFANFFAKKILPHFLRAFAIAFFFISAASPSGLSLFWTTSSVFSLVQILLLKSPRMRRFLRIPKTATEIDKPYRHALNNFLQKFKKIPTEKK